MPTLTICICTYKRPVMLTKCLKSLEAMKAPKDVAVSIAIIDNESSGSARSIFDQFNQRSFPFGLLYFLEKKRGIPCARNRALREVYQLESDYLVFIDDDEVVDEEWLEKLYGYCVLKGGRSVVHGGVFPQVPDDLPISIKGLIEPKIRETGKQLTACATDNVIIPVNVIKGLDLWFDETKPLAGGTDTLFFMAVNKSGVKIYQCSDAIVTEYFPEERLTLRWLCKRKFRAGITAAKRKQSEGDSLLYIGVSSVFRALIDAIIIVVCLVTGRSLDRNRKILRLFKSIGKFMGCFGFKVDSY